MASCPTNRRNAPPRLAILGGGAVTQEFYAPAISLLDWWRGVTIVEKSKQVAKGFRNTFPQANIINDDFCILFGSPEIRSRFDGAVVALPNHLHEVAAKLALSVQIPV